LYIGIHITHILKLKTNTISTCRIIKQQLHAENDSASIDSALKAMQGELTGAVVDAGSIDSALYAMQGELTGAYSRCRKHRLRDINDAVSCEHRLRAICDAGRIDWRL